MAGDAWRSAPVQIIPRLIPYGFLLLCCSVFGGDGISSQGATIPTAASPLSPPPLPSPVLVNATHDVTCWDSERGAPPQFKAGLVDPNGRLTSWQLGPLDCCRRRGVACDSGTGVPPRSELSNSLTAEMPATMGRMLNLRLLDLSKNNLTGEIPATIGRMLNLWMLDLSMNNLTGEIPATIGRLASLQVLDLSRNNLTGGIPLLACPSLIFLNLGSNMLSGNMSSSICGCSALETLDLAHNMLFGIIPSCIGGLRSLRVLNLRSNRFSGEIPSQLSNLRSLQVFDVADNNLTGLIPRELESLKGMMHIERADSSRQVLGIYYSLTLTMHWKGRDLEFVIKQDFLTTSLDMSGNKLSGEIPDSLMNLTGLVSLSLSRNLLTGTISKRIGDMRALETLDLSKNFLFGEIPASMTSLTFLGSLNLSYNNFSGIISIGTQMETFDESLFYGNPLICRPLFQPKCSRDSIQSVDINEDVETNANEGLYFSMGLGFAFGLLVPFVILIIKRSWSTTYFELLDMIVDKFF